MRTIRRTKRNNNRTKKQNRTRKKSKPTVESQKKLVLKMIRELKWPRTQRANVVRPSQVEKSEKGGYEGFVLGIVTSWAGKGSHSGYRKMLSMKTREPKYKKLFNETKKLMRLKDPKFKFTSIQYNKNNRAARHRDAKNVGVSYIVGLGDYTGGELIVFDENEKNPVKHDIRGKFNTFDGSKYPHETAPFKGERYTLVFYST
tara:strand:+ start:1206 stop:1811 length:606 start_codon:yes stop_codon:yes gene_type:complete